MMEFQFLSFRKVVLLAFVMLFLASCGVKKYTAQKNVRNEKVLSRTSVKSEFFIQKKYAEIMGVSPVDIINLQLYSFIEEWLGTPYKYGGLNKNGVDCSGFAFSLIKEVYNKNLPRQSYQQANIVKRKYIGQLEEGDLVFFKFGSKNIDHVGIYLQNGKFVHASTSRGVIISNLQDPWYKKVYIKAGSIH